MKSIRNSLLFGAVLATLIMVSQHHQVSHWAPREMLWSWVTGTLVLSALFLPVAIIAGRRERRRQTAKATAPRRTEGHPRNGRRASADGYVS